jgi:hypothetical protein
MLCQKKKRIFGDAIFKEKYFKKINVKIFFLNCILIFLNTEYLLFCIIFKLNIPIFKHLQEYLAKLIFKAIYGFC